MNHIPDHLKGLSAAEILLKMQATNNKMDNKEYITFLEMHMLIAIKDAMCALTDRELGFTSGLGSEARAIAFLNTICPP